MNLYDRYLRWAYRGGRPNRLVRAQNRLGTLAAGAGIWPSRLAVLQVQGRKSGRTVSLPVVIADYEGQRYLVSMLGARSNWIRNVASAGGRADLLHGRLEHVRLVELPVADRPAIIRRYLAVAPGARPHLPVDRHAPLAAFEEIAGSVPVFRIEVMEGGAAA